MKTILFPAALIILFSSCSFENTIYKENDRFRLTTPDADWVVTFPVDNYTLIDQQSCKEIERYQFTTADKSYAVQCEIIKNAECTDAESCREYFINNPDACPCIAQSETKTEYMLGEAAVVEYFVKTHEGEPVNQNTITAIYYKEGAVIQFHISKPNFKGFERQQMVSFINAISFVPKQG